jgi:hypothetical protein
MVNAIATTTMDNMVRLIIVILHALRMKVKYAVDLGPTAFISISTPMNAVPTFAKTRTMTAVLTRAGERHQDAQKKDMLPFQAVPADGIIVLHLLFTSVAPVNQSLHLPQSPLLRSILLSTCHKKLLRSMEYSSEEETLELLMRTTHLWVGNYMIGVVMASTLEQSYLRKTPNTITNSLLEQLKAGIKKVLCGKLVEILRDVLCVASSVTEWSK